MSFVVLTAWCRRARSSLRVESGESMLPPTKCASAGCCRSHVLHQQDSSNMYQGGVVWPGHDLPAGHEVARPRISRHKVAECVRQGGAMPALPALQAQLGLGIGCIRTNSFSGALFPGSAVVQKKHQLARHCCFDHDCSRSLRPASSRAEKRRQRQVGASSPGSKTPLQLQLSAPFSA